MSTMMTPGKWALDADHSEISMNVRHAGIARVRGKFNDVESSLVLHNDGRYDLEAVIRTDSFDSSSRDRDTHIKSADFLDTEEYPTISFYSAGDNPAGRFFDMEGELTIRGISKKVVFDVEYGGEATDPFGASRAGFIAHAAISRQEFGLTWNAVLETGGVLVGDKVNIELSVSYVYDADGADKDK